MKLTSQTMITVYKTRKSNFNDFIFKNVRNFDLNNSLQNNIVKILIYILCVKEYKVCELPPCITYSKNVLYATLFLEYTETQEPLCSNQ